MQITPVYGPNFAVGRKTYTPIAIHDTHNGGLNSFNRQLVPERIISGICTHYGIGINGEIHVNTCRKLIPPGMQEG